MNRSVLASRNSIGHGLAWRQGVGVSAWWLAGGISAAGCVAAWLAKGAASLADSYINLNTPGTYNLNPIAAPAWSNANGWTPSADAALDTGIVAASQSWSYIARFADLGNAGNCLIGSYSGDYIYMQPHFFGTDCYFANGSVVVFTDPVQTGVVAITGKKIYINGTEKGTFSTGAISTNPLSLLALFNGGAYINKLNGKVYAEAIYNFTLSPAQVVSLTAAMNAL